MEWLEAEPLPDICIACAEEDCYNCDHAGERWCLSPKDELKMRRKMMIKAIERLQRQVTAVDEELKKMQ